MPESCAAVATSQAVSIDIEPCSRSRNSQSKPAAFITLMISTLRTSRTPMPTASWFFLSRALAALTAIAMVRFYEQALGFNVERKLDRISLVQMRAGASLLDLIAAERPQEAANMDHLCFRIEPFDRDAIVTRLAPFGISVGETVERYGAEGNGPSVYFHDPEGNQIELKGPAASPAH